MSFLDRHCGTLEIVLVAVLIGFGFALFCPASDALGEWAGTVFWRLLGVV
ncbi:MAG: hypothetical protein ACLP5H_16545 [Desulfomonilaceae bacterium]